MNKKNANLIKKDTKNESAESSEMSGDANGTYEDSASEENSNKSEEGKSVHSRGSSITNPV
jgi:hypothetical protein